MDIRHFVDRHGGIVHRDLVLDAGVSARALRAAVTRGEIERVRRYWLATEHAPIDLRRAAEASGRVACVSFARQRGWWMPDDIDTGLHLHVGPHAEAPAADAVVHWSRPLVAVGRHVLTESVDDALEHIADCVPHEAALVLWEAAIRAEQRTAADLRRVQWRSAAASRLSMEVTGLSDSGLETRFVRRIRGWGLALQQQVWLAGHPVDVLIGDRLVVQLDGFAHHSSSADRTRDLAHDRELIARGYTVLRFSYVEVMHRWPAVERALRRALAQGAHLAA